MGCDELRRVARYCSFTQFSENSVLRVISYSIFYQELSLSSLNVIVIKFKLVIIKLVIVMHIAIKPLHLVSSNIQATHED